MIVLSSLALAILLQAGSSAGPYRLAIINERAIAITDYPSQERCLRAKAELERQRDEGVRKAVAEAQARGGSLVSTPFDFTVVCFPG